MKHNMQPHSCNIQAANDPNIKQIFLSDKLEQSSYYFLSRDYFHYWMIYQLIVLTWFPGAQGGVFKCLFLSNEQSKTQRYSV